MSGIDYQTLIKMRDEKTAILTERLSGVSPKEKALAGDAESGYWGHGSQAEAAIEEIKQSFLSNCNKKPSDLFVREYKALMEAMVPEEYRQSFLSLVDRLNQFPYPAGWHRRTVRSRDYLPWIDQLPEILGRYSELWLFPNRNLKQLLLGNVESEIQSVYLREQFYTDMDDLLAGELDLGNQDVIETVHTILMSEHNTGIISVGLIRGIIKSNNYELHQLLGAFLVAAKLLEGVRQAICENMDCGTTEAFLTLLSVIEEHGLIRYSSVRRAVCTWIGIFDEKSVDRLTDKMLSLMGKTLRKPEFAKEQLKSKDAVAISCSLWSIGFYDVHQVMGEINHIIEHGTRHQKMVVSYYNSILGFDTFKEQAARVVILSEYEDFELTACFLSSFLPNVYRDINELLSKERMDYFSWRDQAFLPQYCPVTKYFKDKEEAKQFFNILEAVCKKIPKKSMEFCPCIFPWHGVTLEKTDIMARMCLIAYLIGEETYTDKACSMIGGIVTSSNTILRSQITNLLLYRPANRYQQSMLISLINNPEGTTAKKAYEIAKELELSEEDYNSLEGMMKSKRGEVRTRAEYFLMKQKDNMLSATITRLLESGKEECRAGALDMILELKKQQQRGQLFKETRHKAELLLDLTGQEQILLQEISGNDTASQEILNRRGYGFYDPEQPVTRREVKTDTKAVEHFFSMKEEEIIDIIMKLDELVDENRMVEYQAQNGDVCLVGNQLNLIKGTSSNWATLDQLPLEEVWRTFYETYIKDFETLTQLVLYITCRNNTNYYKEGQDVIKKLYGKHSIKTAPYELTGFSLRYKVQITWLLRAMELTYMDRKKAFNLAVNMTGALLSLLTPENCYIKNDSNYYSMKLRFTDHPAVTGIHTWLSKWETEEEFETFFFLKWSLEEVFFKASEQELASAGEIKSKARFGDYPELTIGYFFRARLNHLITEHDFYHIIFEYYHLGQTISVVSSARKFKLEGGSINNWLLNQVMDQCRSCPYAEAKEKEIDNPVFDLLDTLYDKLVPMVLEIELKRGDSATVFSSGIGCVNYISGTDYFVRILTALGKEPLERDCYYTDSVYQREDMVTKRSSMSRLLSACYPAEGEDAETLKKLLKGTDITENRLAEAAMYAPQWIDIIEQYLGWKGLKSGCYYFMAHMNQGFDGMIKAIIAKYTPLSIEELQNGAFDIDWFWEAYHQLGEEHFKKLYDAAKYISYGSMHSRARKYADAARGVVTAEQVKAEIAEKRNKDLLMSYTIIPLNPENREKDLLDRYQYLQQFLKESTQFGAQRRSGEALAVSLAMKNLSTNAGYQDVVRLTLNVEAKLTERYQSYFQWKELGENSFRIAVDKDGTCSLQVQKDGKLLKSIPAKDKKSEYVLALTEAKKKLKEQCSRTKKMMEAAMEDQTAFTAGEIRLLSGNPAAAPIVDRLVFKYEETMGFFKDGQMSAPDGTETSVPDDGKIRLAHPVDFYREGSWHQYQQFLFENEIVQPFKQIFRELYVKLEEELPQKHSMMFAGNQIQPSRAVGCLKNRRWIADYENGLQKVFYKENMIARIYALADWFSPSDIEAPTLEWVEFSGRKDFQALTIGEIPDIIYSEVMRDVDLAVSVAHAGGVDPETSHSTIEMRSAVIEFNLPLFKLENVTLKGSHALIKGTRGEYTVHLGSGVVHQMGGSMVAVLPVHSQKRGKLFLPFVDDDPKTGEIMSKIILFAEDQKIKDPYILKQLSK